MTLKRLVRRLTKTRRGILAFAGLFAILLGILTYSSWVSRDPSSASGYFALAIFGSIGVALIVTAFNSPAADVRRVLKVFGYFSGL